MAKKQNLTTKGLRPPKKHASRAHAKVYWPYLPLIALLLGAAFLNIWQPLQNSKPATLAYSTEMSISGLLSGTNTQRANNGVGALAGNAKLNAAAQAKANDMVARDYWAHNTPDGQEPWIFFDAQGYVYIKAGENLAYGFGTSSETIIGWMNSPSHRANMLDGAFTEVGFGFANSVNFVGTGNATVVVAHYATPAVPAVPAPAAPIAQAPAAPPQTAPANVEAPEPEPEVVEEVVEPEVVEETSSDLPINTDNPVPQEVESKRITLLQQLTNGDAPWSAVALSAAALTLAIVWLVKHGVLVRKYIIEGEHFVAHHPILDLVVLTIIAAAVYLSQSTGVIL